MQVFSILPPRLGGLDMLLPLFMEMKRLCPEIKISVLFVEDRVYSDLSRDPFLFEEFNRVVDSVRRIYKREKARTNLFRAAPAMAGMILDIAKSARPILLHSRGISSPSMKLFHAVVKAKGGCSYQHFSGMPLTIGRQSNARDQDGTEGDGFICFSEHDVNFLREAGYDNLIPVGYPRLFSVWLDRVREMASEFLDREYRCLELPPQEKGVALFLGSMVPGIFFAHELEKWLRDVLQTVQRLMPNTPVLLKPHPIEKTHVLDMIKEVVNDYPMARLTFLHPGILAAGSRLVVSHHSSTILDSMALGVPTIQYQELTPHWLKNHPEGSSFLKLDPLWARNTTELVECIEKALSEVYMVPDIRPVLDHKENLITLLEGRQ